MSLLSIAARLTLCAALVSTVSAQSLVGRLVDPNGVGIAGATFIFSNGGPTVNTGLNGDFNFTGLRNRTYDTVQIDPRRNDVAPTQMPITVNGVTNIGTIQLAPGALCSGVLLSPTGTGVLGANMNAYLPNGTKLFTPRDGTDLNGNFNIVVPYGDVVIRAVPPVGSNYVPYNRQHTFSGPLDLGTIQLRQGLVVTGSVISGGSLLPISGAEVLTYDALTGEELTQLTRRTNAFGAFSLLLPIGLYRFEVLPPLLNLHQGREIFNVTVLSAMNVGQIALKPAVVLQGVVRDTANQPIVGIDIDVITTDGYKLFTVDDNTLATGQFAVLVPPGTYSIRVDPLVNMGLVGAQTGLITVTGNTNAGIITLQPGVPALLRAVDSLGNGIPNVNLDLIDPTTGAKPVIPGDVTGPDGWLLATVPTGTFDVHMSPAQGSPFAPYTQPSVPVNGPMQVTFTMAEKLLVTNLTTFGVPAISVGGFPINLSFHVRQQAPLPTTLELFVQLPDGTELPMIPPVTLDLFPGFPITLGGIWIPAPPAPASQIGRVLRLVTRYTNPANGQLFDQSYVDFVVE